MLIKTNTQDPVLMGLRVWPQAIPQFLVGHFDILESAKSALNAGGYKGLLLAGNYVSGVAMGRCVEGAYEVAEEELNLIVKASSSLGGAAAGVSRNAWQLLSIFLATIVGIITQPLSLGVVALMGLGDCVLTKILTFAAAFFAFGDPIPWLIALAFFFAKRFIKTGLGNRIAYQFVKLFGSLSLGLGYSLVFSEGAYKLEH
ncbi:primary active transporter [Lithospermum erythrorhizon]|uniref:Primary active transporter n=1 Tax=Lithospermum erythrorhizon TaxID=34254 RepID=A0AAV3NH78_LITER